METLAAVGYFGAAKAVMGWLGVPVGPARPPLDNPAPRQLAELRAKLDDFPWFGPQWRPAASHRASQQTTLTT